MSTYETHRPLRTLAPPPKRLVIMGVSGCGKTSLAGGLGVALGWDVLDADHLHPATNVEKMRQGIPLQDADRWPWLDAVATSLAAPLGASDGRVVACSALKRVYRETIRRGCPGTHFVFLEGTFEAVLPRLQARAGHYMPASLLQTQFATLECPGTDEQDVSTLPLTWPVAELVATVTSLIGLPCQAAPLNQE